MLELLEREEIVSVRWVETVKAVTKDAACLARLLHELDFAARIPANSSSSGRRGAVLPVPLLDLCAALRRALL